MSEAEEMWERTKMEKRTLRQGDEEKKWMKTWLCSNFDGKREDKRTAAWGKKKRIKGSLFVRAGKLWK